MSRSPYFFVERYNEITKRYELQHPIIWNSNHTAQEQADLFPYNGCHDLFSIVTNNEMSSLPEMYGVHHGLPNGACEEINKAYKNCTFTEEDRTFSPTAHWFTYADMYIYYLEHPKVVDYEAMDEAYLSTEDEKTINIMTDNPIKTLKDRVDSFLEVCDYWSWRNYYSQIRIVYWIM